MLARNGPASITLKRTQVPRDEKRAIVRIVTGFGGGGNWKRYFHKRAIRMNYLSVKFSYP